MGTCASSAVDGADVQHAPQQQHKERRQSKVTHGKERRHSWQEESSVNSKHNSFLDRMQFGNEYAVTAPATSYSDNRLSINAASFIAHLQQQQQMMSPPVSEHGATHSYGASQRRISHNTAGETARDSSAVGTSTIRISSRNALGAPNSQVQQREMSASSQSYKRKVDAAHVLAQGQLQQLLKQAQSLLPAGAQVPVIMPMQEPQDCTEVEEYYDEDRADYMEYVRRWEAAKELETRSSSSDAAPALRVERSLFFGRDQATLKEATEAALAALMQPSVPNVGMPAAVAGDAANTGSLDIDTECKEREQPLTPRSALSPRNLDDLRSSCASPVPYGRGLYTLPVVPHIAQRSLLEFMHTLIAENDALVAQALADAVKAQQNHATHSGSASPLPTHTPLSITTHLHVSSPCLSSPISVSSPKPIITTNFSSGSSHERNSATHPVTARRLSSRATSLVR